MTEDLKNTLRQLVQKYETSSFMDADPSQFIRWYSRSEDIEAASFS